MPSLPVLFFVSLVTCSVDSHRKAGPCKRHACADESESSSTQTQETSETEESDTTSEPSTSTSESTGVTCDGVFPDTWIRGGPDCGTEPEIEVHRYNDDTFILRQSLCTSFEAPFLYLFFGDDRALLEDTGAGGISIAQTVLELVSERERETGRPITELLVVNSHGHGDHTAGNNDFADESGVVVIGTTVSALSGFFDLDWPDGNAQIDLGNRIIDLLPIPGHESAHIALYDRTEGLLLTGDSLYPGRLYISDFEAFHDSIDKLVDFTATREICHVLGTHIEMTTTAGSDYDFGATDHPDEHVLELSRDHVVELADALALMANDPVYEIHDDFIIYP